MGATLNDKRSEVIILRKMGFTYEDISSFAKLDYHFIKKTIQQFRLRKPTEIDFRTDLDHTTIKKLLKQGNNASEIGKLFSLTKQAVHFKINNSPELKRFAKNVKKVKRRKLRLSVRKLYMKGKTRAEIIKQLNIGLHMVQQCLKQCRNIPVRRNDVPVTGVEYEVPMLYNKRKYPFEFMNIGDFFKFKRSKKEDNRIRCAVYNHNKRHTKILFVTRIIGGYIYAIRKS